MRLRTYVALALVAAAPAAAFATDPPHDEGANCAGCHFGHNAPGGSLTVASGIANLCQSCHSPVGAGGPTGFGFPWALSDQAVPGTSGRSHSWSGLASNQGATPPDPGSSDPVEAAMGGYLDAGGSLKCTTCHDAHQSDAVPGSGRGAQHVSAPAKTVAAGGSGTVAVTSAPAELPSKAYVIQLTTGGAVGTARFRVSNDKKISWVQSNVAAAASVSLADGVVLAFGGGGFVAGEEYQFYVSYPFVRANNTGSAMCVACHKDRNMRWQDVEGRTDGRLGTGIVLGTTVFSHPVGQALNANGRGYDRTAGVLEPTGAAQATGDGNESNDLALDASGLVGCSSCHHVHNADSNSLTADPR